MRLAQRIQICGDVARFWFADAGRRQRGRRIDLRRIQDPGGEILGSVRHDAADIGAAREAIEPDPALRRCLGSRDRPCSRCAIRSICHAPDRRLQSRAGAAAPARRVASRPTTTTMPTIPSSSRLARRPTARGNVPSDRDDLRPALLAAQDGRAQAERGGDVHEPGRHPHDRRSAGLRAPAGPWALAVRHSWRTRPYPNVLDALDLTKPGAPLQWTHESKPLSAAQGAPAATFPIAAPPAPRQRCTTRSTDDRGRCGTRQRSMCWR